MTDDRDLIREFQAGSESAARELFDKYCERLMRLAKRRIGQRMNSRVDPEDVIQSAFRTFFVHVKNDEFTFEGENDLFKLLVRLTVHKTLRQIASIGSESAAANARQPTASSSRRPATARSSAAAQTRYAAPPPGTTPSRTAARAIVTADSIRVLSSSRAASDGAPTTIVTADPASLPIRSWSRLFSQSLSLTVASSARASTIR